MIGATYLLHGLVILAAALLTGYILIVAYKICQQQQNYRYRLAPDGLPLANLGANMRAFIRPVDCCRHQGRVYLNPNARLTQNPVGNLKLTKISDLGPLILGYPQWPDRLISADDDRDLAGYIPVEWYSTPMTYVDPNEAWEKLKLELPLHSPRPISRA